MPSISSNIRDNCKRDRSVVFLKDHPAADFTPLESGIDHHVSALHYLTAAEIEIVEGQQ